LKVGDLVNVTTHFHGTVGYVTPGIVLQHNVTADVWHRWTVYTEGDVRACHDHEVQLIDEVT
jgi:hypothetical protein